jgi:hypothetical protein
MQSHCEHPYRAVISMAGAVRQSSDDATEWHLRRLAAGLARAVFDLDARMRAGLMPPSAWCPPSEYPDTSAKQAHTGNP